MIKRNQFAAVMLISALLLSAACGSREGPGAGPVMDQDHDKKIIVVASFDALYEIAKAIGGDRAVVSKIMPDGTEAHEFEPQARDLEALSSADVLITNGLGFDMWAQRAASAASNDKLLSADVSAGVSPISVSGQNNSDAQSLSESQETPFHGLYDPHIWLSPVCASQIAWNIYDALRKADPAGDEYYNTRYVEFKQTLEALYSEYREKINLLESRIIVTDHAVFAYLCRDFDLIQNSVEGVFAEGEPSAKALAELIEYCRDNGVTTIFTECLSSPLVADTLAAEAGARVSVIYTMEGAEDDLTFLERMEMNLETIYTALKN